MRISGLLWVYRRPFRPRRFSSCEIRQYCCLDLPLDGGSV